MYEKGCKNQEGFAPILILALVVIVGIVIAIFYLKTKNNTSLLIPNTTPSSGIYKCLETQYVDCMPKVSDGKTGASPFMCSKEYLSWAQNNCPNFKGAAY